MFLRARWFCFAKSDTFLSLSLLHLSFASSISYCQCPLSKNRFSFDLEQILFAPQHCLLCCSHLLMRGSQLSSYFCYAIIVAAWVFIATASHRGSDLFKDPSQESFCCKQQTSRYQKIWRHHSLCLVLWRYHYWITKSLLELQAHFYCFDYHWQHRFKWNIVLHSFVLSHFLSLCIDQWLLIHFQWCRYPFRCYGPLFNLKNFFY